VAVTADVVALPKRKWQAARPLTDDEKRGFAFWVPVALAIAGVELAGALSGAFKNWIPWPTISSTIGHIENRASWVGVTVVVVIAMAAYQAISDRAPNKSEVEEVKVRLPFVPFDFRYDVVFVFQITALVTYAVARWWSDDKIVYGYTIYGSFLVFGILVPSALVNWARREARFPSVWVVVHALRVRFRPTPLILVAGLAVLVIHLALYPWPDITRESTTYAGLTALDAQGKALRAIRKLRIGMPGLRYSAQTRGIDNGREAWVVYFTPSSGSGAAPYSGCVVVVSDGVVNPTPECSK
jgi:hypothetical protein